MSTQTTSKRIRPMSHPFTLLVTVGSTLFPSLTSHILLPAFLSLLQSLGVQRLVVQYGRAELELENNVKRTLSVNSQGVGRGVWSDSDGDGDGDGAQDKKETGMVVEVMRFTSDFEGLVKNSDAVISHAGMVFLQNSILTYELQLKDGFPKVLDLSLPCFVNHPRYLYSSYPIEASWMITSRSSLMSFTKMVTSWLLR